jgi:hypothetical protein
MQTYQMTVKLWEQEKKNKKKKHFISVFNSTLLHNIDFDIFFLNKNKNIILINKSILYEL